MVRQQLYKRQNEIGEYIINLKQSCLKETARSVVKETCKAQLGQVWQEFKNNHTKLTELGITEEPYFKNKYYEKVNSLVEEICAALETNEDAASQLETGKTESSGLKLQQIQPQENGESKNEKERIAGKRKERIRKLIRKLVGELLELEQLNIKVLLEEAKRSWETQMNQINDLLWELTINHEGSYEDITKEVDEVENLYKRSKTTLILRLDKCKEERCPIKLAEIKIPDFYGNVEEWPSFHDLYKKLVHDAESLSDVEKMFYLKAHIKGEASKVIKHLPADGSNYQPAWEILNQRFGNKRILFQTILDRLLDQPHVCSENAKQVKGLLDTTIECVQGLKAMKCNIEDAVMARVIIRKLDKEGLLLYEQHTKKSKEIQELKDVLEFLEERYQNLEAAGTKKYSSNYNHRQQQPMKSTTLYTDKSACLYCRKQGHLTEECRSLLRLPVAERVSWVKTKNICHRCLNHNQNARCDSTIKCGTCGFKHHSVLHLTKTSTTCVANGTRSVLLATAQVQVKNIHGEMVTLKALVDQGSQSTFLREEAAQILQIPREKANMELHGLGDNLVGVAKSKVKVRIHPRFPSNYSLDVEALILPALASVHLDSSLVHNQGVWKNFQLADPNYYKNERIDMVLGGDVYVDILKNGIHKKHGMLGQHTKLGLMLSGPLTIRVPVARKGVNVTTEIERFWETEELDMDMVTNDDEKCLDNYAATTKRNEEGRFIVQIPFKEDKELGTSYKQAAARLISLEKKLIKDNAMKHEYSRIMEEYIALGHMKPVKQIHSGKYYLPHQAVVREDSLTTKVRVVFDGSASTNNGRSLNDIMHVGPRLQRDVFDILLNFRLKRFVISSDVEKMYRQIMVDEESQRYQHVLWRKDRNEEIKEYQLTTVTFGTASAPFLAVRTLMQIAKECADTKVKQIIEEDFYMDDLLTGADTIEECLQLRFKISRHLEGYGFHLRKWCSNNEHIVKSSKEDKENEIININETTNVKTLGLQWKPKEDEFRFKISEYPAESTTKRLALSYLAKIFDPLGLLTPVIITAKLFIQSLWLLEMQWDQKIDGDLEISWKEFVTRISSLQDVKIPRWLNSSSESKIKILGFADASEKAYAAVVYIKTDKGVSLMAAKSKVNPIKNKKTLPKLELCAAFLLARLLNRIISVVKAESEVYAWSDSTITLAWIENNKSKDKFIRSRVTGIKNLVSQAQWRYVKSKENPADLGSRGVSPDKLVDSKLWWEGPQWLLLPEAEWSLTPPELKTCASTASKEAPTLLNDLIERYSSYGRLLRVYSYILRFVEKLKGTRSFPSYLTREELLKAEKYIVKGHQKIEWPSEVQKLRDNRQMDHRHKLANLHPYLDEEGVLRVGGRLQYSDLQLDQKHPMIIRKSRLAYLIIRDTHYKTMHGGNRLVECTVRRKFWIINVKNCIKKVIRSCPVCIRYKQQNTQQLMGILPDYRVKVSFPFYHCGVDYAGPVSMKFSSGRGQRSFKGYIAVFICMTTRAIHLEAVSGLTTDAFMAALKRFFARRGKSAHIYSDNGTNFVGAAGRLEKEFQKVVRQNADLAEVLENHLVKWHFIPPASPHFGGLWEAAVKSMKYHLKRIIGETKMTYEEMSTLLAQIEAILNSRPMCSMSEADEGLEVLTPGHFLVGRPLIEVPESINDSAIGCLDRWKLVQRMKKDFWSSWSNDYLVTLQQRYKWKTSRKNLQEGQVVIIKNEETHPARWPLARITQVHPGKDSLVRAVTVKTASNIMKRPVNKICPLENVSSVQDNRDVTHVNYTRVEKKVRWKMSHIWALLLIYIGCIRSDPIQIGASLKEIKESAIIYLDHVGSVDVVSSKWNLLVYYDMEPFFGVIEKANPLVKDMRMTCGKLQTFEPQCNYILNTIERQLLNMEQTNKYLFPLITKRSKRAPLEFIGSLQHILFGTMDAEDRKAMELNMKNLLDNQYNLKFLVKQQTSVVESTINILRRTTDEVNQNFKSIVDRVDNITETVKEEYFVYRESTKFFMVVKELQIIVEENERVQLQMLALLIDINHGKLNPSLITPIQLQEEINKIREYIPDHLKLPGTAENQLRSIYKLLKAKASVIENRLVVSVWIPLFSDQVSQLHEMIGVPFERLGRRLIPVLRSDYIIYNFKMDAYHLFSESELNNCQTFGDEEYVCDGGWPWIDANDQSCETSPLKPRIKPSCKFDDFAADSFWKKLALVNSWMFKVFNQTTGHIQCSSRSQRIIELPLQGVLEVEPGCTVRTLGTTITAPLSLQSSRDVEDRVNFTADLAQIEEFNMLPLGPMIINHTRQVDEVMTKLRDVQKTNVDLRGLQFHHMSGHAALILVILIIIILAICFIKKFIQRQNVSALNF